MSALAASEQEPRLIVGIGASAGGLDAFKAFLGATPADSGLAFVLVQHLSPSHKSMLAELLGKVTTMAVVEATDGAPVEANGVFVIPPDSTLTIADGRLRVSRPAPPRDHRRPIDTFFQSLATAGLSPERLERWFTNEGDDCCVIPEIREMCVFSTHSIIKHPPFSKLDLISCRNLLIYLDTAMQDR